MSENNGDRDERGRFRNGHAKPGPGRPARETEAEYLQTLATVATPERWKAICERAVIDAVDGDYKAREWLSRYLIGDAPAVSRLAGRLSCSAGGNTPGGNGHSPLVLQ